MKESDKNKWETIISLHRKRLVESKYFDTKLSLSGVCNGNRFEKKKQRFIHGSSKKKTDGKNKMWSYMDQSTCRSIHLLFEDNNF